MNGHHYHHHTAASNATAADGSTNFKTLYDEIETASGFSMRKELNALITEVYLSGKYDTQIEKSAALTVGMQGISKHLYEVTMTEMISSDDPATHDLALHAMTVSFHKPNMHDGRGHSGTQDRGSHELMHVLNPRKETDNVREYFFDDHVLSAQEGAELREIFKGGTTFADMFGKNGGNSADGLLGQSMHPTGLRNLAEWSGVDLPRWADAWSHAVSVQFVGWDSHNTNGIFLGMGKKGHGGSDKSHGDGRAKFEETFDFNKVAEKLDFVAGKASGVSQTPVVDGPGHNHQHGDHGADYSDDGQDHGHDHTSPDAVDIPPMAMDDAARTTQNSTIVVDVLVNDDADLTLQDISYDGDTSRVSIVNNKIKVNPLNAHRNDRTEEITYTAVDAAGETVTAVLKVEIGGGKPPKATVTPPKKPEPVQEPSPIEDAELLEFFFVNTASDEVIGKVEDGATVSAADLSGPVSIFAMDVADGIDVNAVRLSHDGHTQFERVEPYALFGDKRGDFYGGTTFEQGTHELEVDIFGAKRQELDSMTLTFDVI